MRCYRVMCPILTWRVPYGSFGPSDRCLPIGSMVSAWPAQFRDLRHDCRFHQQWRLWVRLHGPRSARYVEAKPSDWDDDGNCVGVYPNPAFESDVIGRFLATLQGFLRRDPHDHEPPGALQRRILLARANLIPHFTRYRLNLDIMGTPHRSCHQCCEA